METFCVYVIGIAISYIVKHTKEKNVTNVTFVRMHQFRHDT